MEDNEIRYDVADVMILKHARMGKNISEITKDIPLTYSSIFNRITELEKKGVLNIISSNHGNKIEVNPLFQHSVRYAISKFDSSEDDINHNFLKSEENKKILKKFLHLISKKRFITMEDVDKNFNNTEYSILLFTLDSMCNLGIIEKRYEIRKYGKKLLKDLKENKK